MNTFLKENIKPILILIVCILLFIVFAILSDNKTLEQLSVSRISTPMVDVDGSIKESELPDQEDIAIPSIISSTSVSDDAMSYGDFLKLYGDKRIQFNDTCQATPGSASFTVGDFLIFDNRSSKVQAVKFIDDLYALPPFHVRVFELKRQGIFDIDCGSSKNVAKIIVH